MPGNEAEIPILVRQFTGVDIETDPAFLPNDYLQASQNLVPVFDYLLEKRDGTILSPMELLTSFSDNLPWQSPRIDAIHWARDAQGTNLVFFVVTTLGDGVTTAKGDRLMVGMGSPPAMHELFVYDAAVNPLSVAPDGSPLTTGGGSYGLTVLGGKLYVGNGQNAIITIDIDNVLATPVVLDALQSMTVTVTPADVSATTSNGLLPGTYSYRFALLDMTGTVGVWTHISDTETIVVGNTDPRALQFPVTACSQTVDATHTLHLFLSPSELPVEYARDQGIITALPTTLTINQYNDQGDLTPLKGAAYTGRFLVRHRGRIWIAGDLTNNQKNQSRLYATNAIVPGLEQQLYNWGDFFPAGANAPINDHDGDVITGIAVSQGGANRDAAFAPVIIFKNAATYLWFGDIVDDDTAQLIQVSDKVGCVAPQTIVPTAEGVIWMGIDTVYYFSSAFTEPLDIGIPIRNAIEGIPRNRLHLATATFHRGWYKLAITPFGGTTNSQEWWFDLRPSTGSNQILQNAKWWGPHACMPVTTMEVGTLDPAERERLYVGREVDPIEQTPIVDICYADQDGTYTDPTATPKGGTRPTPVIARLKTGGLVQDEPFQWKDWTSIRMVVLPAKDTPITVNIYADGGLAQSVPTMNQNFELDAGPPVPPNVIQASFGGALWDVAVWNVDVWGDRRFVEGWSEITPVIRSHSLEVEFIHNDPIDIHLRDVEIRYRPVQRRAPGAV